MATISRFINFLEEKEKELKLNDKSIEYFNKRNLFT